MEPPSLTIELRKLLLWLILACFSRKFIQKQIDWTDSFSQKRWKWAWFTSKWAWFKKLRTRFACNCTTGTPLQEILDPPLLCSIKSACTVYIVIGALLCTYQCITPGTTPRARVGDLTYVKSIASPLEQILGSNAPIIGLYFPPYYS